MAKHTAPIITTLVFESSVRTIYQSFGGQGIYLSAEEKAANLLYFVVKNYSF